MYCGVHEVVEETFMGKMLAQSSVDVHNTHRSPIYLIKKMDKNKIDAGLPSKVPVFLCHKGSDTNLFLLNAPMSVL